MAKMLSLYPESATQVTQFGELPLHLAVETGCVLEVVNLLLVSYFQGINHKDNSGRTPLDIATDNEHGDKLVLECLQRAFKAHACMVSSLEKAVKQLKREHKLSIQHLKSQQDIQLRAERERQATLEESFTKIQQHVQASEEARQKMKQQVSIHKKARGECEQKMEKLCQQIVMLQDEMTTEQQANKDLLEELSEKQDEIQRLRLAVDTLSKDLSLVTLKQHQTIAQQVVQTEKDMKTFLISQQTLKAQLVSQAKQMQVLFKERGIEMPVSPKKKDGEEKKEAAEDIDSQQVADAAAQAAFAALQEGDN
jgi:chromosome segregation ATPase